MKTEAFDEALKSITQIRGDDYGHPADDFAVANQIAHAVNECPDPLVRHAYDWRQDGAALPQPSTP